MLYIIDPNIVWAWIMLSNVHCFPQEWLGIVWTCVCDLGKPRLKQVLRCAGSWLVTPLWGPVEIFVPGGGLVIHHAAYRRFPKDPGAITTHLCEYVCVCGMFICDIREWATMILLMSHRPPSLSNLSIYKKQEIVRKGSDKAEKWNGERNKRSTILSQEELLCLSGSLPIKRKWAEVIAMESTWVVP